MPTGETTLYLMRHAELDWDRTTPELDWPLTPNGHLQASAMVPRLATLDIDVVYSSPATRARATVSPFCEAFGLRPIIEPDLRERQLTWPPPSRADIAEHYRRSWEDFDYKLPGFESNREGQIRFGRALRSIAQQHPGERVLVCAHGNVIVLALHECSADLDPSREHLDFCEIRRIQAGMVWTYDPGFRMPS